MYPRLFDADQAGLLDWARGCGTGVKGFFLVHGDPDQSQGLATKLGACGSRCTVPADGQTVELR